jgi:CheY-like chemotaxis protein
VRLNTAHVVSQRLRILLVDDDPLLIKSLNDTLEGDGHVISVAHGGQAGIDAFAAAARTPERFSVVISLTSTAARLPHRSRGFHRTRQ